MPPRGLDATGGQRPGSSLERIVVAGLVVLHLGLGLALLPTPMFAKYPQAAQLLLRGQLPAEEAADFSPLYLLIHLRLPGGWIHTLQQGLGVLSALALYRLTRRMWGPLAGMVALGLFALSAPVLLFEATLEPELVALAGLAVALDLLSDPVDRPASLGRLVAAGVALGFSLAARPVLAPFALAMGAWLGHQVPGWRQRVRGPALFLIPAVLVAALPALALKAIAHQPLETTLSMGQVAYQGNRPEGMSYGAQSPFLLKELELHTANRPPDYAHQLYRRFARAELGAGASPQDCERFWITKMLAFARWHPGGFVRMWGRRLELFFLGPDAHDVSEVRVAAGRISSWPLTSSPLLGALGLGALMSLALVRRTWLPLLLVAANMALAALAFQALARYRLPVLAAWCPLAGALVAEIALRRSLTAGLLLALPPSLLFAASLELPLVRDASGFLSRAAEISVEGPRFEDLRTSGDLVGATSAFVHVLAEQPFFPLIGDLRGIPFDSPDLINQSLAVADWEHDNRTDLDRLLGALLAARANRCDEVLARTEQPASDGFQASIFNIALDPELLRADCLVAQGDREGAQREVLRSLRARPGTADGLSAAIASALPGEQGFREELFALHDVLSARYALARAFRAWGRPAEALKQSEQLVGQLPESGWARDELASDLAALGRTGESVRTLEQAMALCPACAFDTRPFSGAAAAAAAAHPEDPTMIRLGAELALREGRLADAAAAAQAARAQGAPATDVESLLRIPPVPSP